MHMEDKAKNMGKNIRALRLEKGWTQQDLADKLGTTQKTITAYECGTRHPTAEKIPQISALFGITVNEIYGATFTRKNGKAKNPKLWKKFEQVENLPESDRRSIFRMIDGLLAGQKSSRCRWNGQIAPLPKSGTKLGESGRPLPQFFPFANPHSLATPARVREPRF